MSADEDLLELARDAGAADPAAFLRAVDAIVRARLASGVPERREPVERFEHKLAELLRAELELTSYGAVTVTVCPLCLHPGVARCHGSRPADVPIDIAFREVWDGGRFSTCSECEDATRRAPELAGVVQRLVEKLWRHLGCPQDELPGQLPF